MTVLLEHCIALLQMPIVLNESRQILRILLAKLLIHESSALIATAQYELIVLRRNYYQREATDMIAQSFIFFLVPMQYLVLPRTNRKEQLYPIAAFIPIKPLQQGHFFSMSDNHIVRYGKMAATEREEMQRIQQISLAHSIVPHQTVHFGRKPAIGSCDTLKIDDMEFFYDHSRWGKIEGGGLSRPSVKRIPTSVIPERVGTLILCFNSIL